MLVNINQLNNLFANKKFNVDNYVDPLNTSMEKYNINTSLRISMFLAQVLFESNYFTEIVENLNYSANGLLKTFPTHFNSQQVEMYAYHAEMIGNRVYANRMGNNNEYSGDGYKFRGRGLIQLTGKENYQHLANDLNMTLDNVVNYLEGPYGACMSAAWFWNNHKLNDYADRKDINGCTKIINGGYNGLEERKQIYNNALKIFG